MQTFFKYELAQLSSRLVTRCRTKILKLNLCKKHNNKGGKIFTFKYNIVPGSPNAPLEYQRKIPVEFKFPSRKSILKRRAQGVLLPQIL